MATIDITRVHKLGKDEARKRANGILEKMKTSAGIKGEWRGDNFDIQAPAKGTFFVSEQNVRIELDLPFMLRPLKGKIEEKINEEFDKSLT